MAAPPESIARLFAPGNQLSRVHESYEDRPGQREMARRVAAVLKDGGRLMIEAGTGTGKTLAYLVPALTSGRRVIVSTGTRNLQDQIYNVDLPFLRGRLGLDFSACVMKGRDNYLCRYRLAEFAREPLLEDLREKQWVPRIVDWSRSTETGDRAEIADLPDSLRLWRDVNARADTCSGTHCPEYENCWLTVVKRRAQESQVVVVNHHLFFADLALRTAFGNVLPDYDSVIFDEAHLLEEVVTLYFGVQLTAGQLEELARQAERLAARSGGQTKGGGGSALLREAAGEFFRPLREALGSAAGRKRFRPAERGGLDLEGEWAVLSEALEEVERQTSRLAANKAGAEALPTKARDLRGALSRVLDRRQPDHVYGMELRGRGNVILTAAPIDVSNLLREHLFEGLHACVLTSATLAVDGDFDFFQKRLGLQDADGRVVESSFDHRNQAVLYLPERMPEPRQPEFVARAVEQIIRLLEITEGRGFLLFTSYAVLGRVEEALADLDRWPLLVQGQGSKVALVEAFKERRGSVLLGTTSFWHGVDVPGEALSLVVVDKIPFDVPSDPLIAARIDRIRDDNGNPFNEYQVPLAVLELKQGLGRLIRRRTDRGILAVLDPRLTTRRYGKTFLTSLPPYRVVRDLDSCARFMNGPRIDGYAPREDP